MRAIIGGYLSVGVALLALGFFATGPCPVRQRNLVSDTVFVLGWPVYLYDNVAHHRAAAPEWLHRETCPGGAVTYRI